MHNKHLYENYHLGSKLQREVITYDNFTYRNTLDVIRKYISNKKTLLDIGSATGTISLLFASQGMVVDGIEISENGYRAANLNKNKLKIKGVKFHNKSIEEFKTNKKYDLILCLEVIEHIVDDAECLRKITKFMNKDSVLIISVPSQNAPLFKLGLLTKFDKKVGHLRRYSLTKLRCLLESSNLKILEEYEKEGLIRSLLYSNPILGMLIRLTRFSIFNNLFTVLDKISLKLFNESQLIIVCKLGK